MGLSQLFFDKWLNLSEIASVISKLMRLASANGIDVVESNLKSESERRILVDSDSNDLIESLRSIFDINRSIFD